MAEGDLTKRLMQCIRECGRGQVADRARLGEETVHALLQTVAAICVFQALSEMGLSAERLSDAFRALEREEPLDDEDWVLPLRARKEVLLRHLRHAVDAF